MLTNRRAFLGQLLLGTTGLGMGTVNATGLFSRAAMRGDIMLSLCELSLTSSIRRGWLKHLDFPLKAKREWNITTVEYGSVFFRDRVSDSSYLKEMLQRTRDAGVSGLRINITDEGELAG